jgi:hypothetical protein
MSYTGVHLPRGYELAIQTNPAVPNVYTDLGVTYEDGSIEATYTTVKWSGSRAEKLNNFYKDFTVTINATLAQIDLEKINLIMSGGADYSAVAGSLVTGHVQTSVAGGWARETFIPFDRSQAAGTAPASLVVTNPGSLVLGTDYIVIKQGTQWGVVVLAARGNLANNLVFTYNYTPAASKILTMGSQSVNVTPRAVRMRKNLGTDSAPKYFTVVLYSAVNEAGFSLAFPRFDADTPALLPVTIVGSLDTTRSDLDQLLSITDEYGV